MKIQKYISKILDVLIAFILLLFFASFGFQDSRTSGWYQQWFPNLNGSTITSMTFLDSLTGFAVTNSNTSNQSFILKTTNGGDNWNIQLTTYPNFNKIMFADKNIGYASAYTDALFKTSNSGENWFTLSNGGIFPNDMAVLNKDTILFVESSPIWGGVFRTTNSGQSWQRIWAEGGTNQNPNNIYMYNKDIGFNLGSSGMKKTTNGGVNWFVIPGEVYTDIQLIDSLIGWKTYDGIKKTTNGGLNWFTQQLPNLQHYWWRTNLFVLNKDTIWMGGDATPPNYMYNPLYKTTNGGINWGYQIPGTNIDTLIYAYIHFTDKQIGWAYDIYWNSGIHTKVGGNDTTYFTGINNNNSVISDGYQLYQNYPNPFNQLTIINYQLSKSSNITLKIFDITGKEILTLVNGKQNAGTYEVKFDARLSGQGSNLASGIYFYSLYANGVRVETKKMLMVK